MHLKDIATKVSVWSEALYYKSYYSIAGKGFSQNKSLMGKEQKVEVNLDGHCPAHPLPLKQCSTL